MIARTRIAPSPTGELHIGHMRTILYDYAFAKKYNGQFIVRIEDTDRNRFVEGAADRTLQIIKDYGFSWDEGPGIGGPYEPYVQTQRLEIYKKYALELIEKGGAYYCFCTPERLDQVRAEQQAQHLPKTCYDKHCRNLSKEEVEKNLKDGVPYVIRIKIPANETVVLHDAIHGDISFNTNDVDDMILLKSDGIPTYHLAAMVDDHLMKITHVLRGIDWMPSSPVHVLIYKFLGWDMPIIAHLPNLKEKGSAAKLSKRQGAVAAVDFLQEGYLVEALVNFLMFVGWNPGTEKEIYTLDEFINDFSLERIQKTDLVAFDRDKLLWFNGYYIRNLSDDVLFDKIKAWAKRFEIKLNFSGDDKIDIKVVALIKERLKKFSEVNDLISYFYSKPEVKKEMLISYTKSEERTKEILNNFYNTLEITQKENWTRDNLEKVCHDLITKYEYSPKEAFMTLRVALSGQTATPHIFDILEVLGREESLDRIKSAL